MSLVDELASREGEPDEIARAAVTGLDLQTLRALAVDALVAAITAARRTRARDVEEDAVTRRGDFDREMSKEDARTALLVADLQSDLDAGNVSIEFAREQISAINRARVRHLKAEAARAGLSAYDPHGGARWSVTQTVYANVDGQPWVANTVKLRGDESDRPRQQAAQRIAENDAKRESERRLAREKAGLPRVSRGWGDDMSHALNNLRNVIRLELTKELLASEFALGDGRTVTWGDATVSEHEQRLTMLVAQASGTMETAERHHEAARMLREADAPTLNALAAALPQQATVAA